MNTKEWLNKVAYICDTKDFDGGTSKIYQSKFDDSYITRVGMEDKVKYLANREITEQLTHGVGYSPKDGKWYGWSHRAIYGFDIGSTCSVGDCHYVAETPEKLIEDRVEFFSDLGDEYAEQVRAECQILEDRSGIRILHTPIKMATASNFNELSSAISSSEYDLPEVNLFENSFTVIKCGKGEWTAKTKEDAKQMAIDFNKGVS